MKKYVFIILLSVMVANAGIIHPQLVEKLATLNDNEPLQVIVHMKAQADLSTLPEGTTKAEKILYLQEYAEYYQADLLNYLANFSDKINNLKTFWIFDGLTFSTTKDIIVVVAARNDVDYVIDDFIITIDPVIKTDIKVDDSRTPEWNVTKVSAPQCWNIGYDGAGIIVGNMDTGVDVNHIAFHGRWVSGGWFDAVNGQTTPYDDNNHGTHTMGTTCGGDGNGPDANDVGVAPGANFICAKAFNSSGQGQASWIHACFQWFATQNARVVGNSWGSSTTTSTEYWNDCQNWRNLGIYPVFSIGNNGSGSGTAGTPGNFPIVTGVGATDSGDNISGYSSRGPAPNQSPWNDPANWGRPDWNLIKPDISAPGTSIRSSIPGGGYQGGWSGTSMACPHVTGAVAICLQKNPIVDYVTLYNILLNNADHPSQGGTYPNNNYGWGRLNAYAALQALPIGNAPNIVIQRTAVVNDNNGNGKLDPGENAGIVTYLRNIGNVAATNTQGTLRTTDTYITINDSTTNYGTIAAGDSANNAGDPFTVVVSSSCPQGHIVNFDLYIVCAETSCVRNFSLTVGTPGLDYATHDVGNCKLTITRYGAIGFMGSNQVGGVGFIFPITGANHLFYGGFAAGNAASYVVDRYYESASGDDADWNTTTNPDGMVKWFEPGPNNFDEYGTAIYSDSGHASPKGLICEQYSWAWDDPTANDFVTIKFVLKNQGTTTLTNLYAAVFMDWDIGTYSSNQGSSETARNLTWMYYTTPYVGVEILDPPRTVPARNLALIDHDLYVYPNNGLPDNIQIQFMDGTITNPSSNRPYDWSTCNSAGPFTLAPGESRIAAFAILGGTNLNDLQVNADTAYNRYWNWPGVEENLPIKEISSLRIYPMISNGRPYMVQYNFSAETPLKLKIYDAVGRLITEKDYGKINGRGEIQLSLSSFAQGIYFVKIETSKEMRTEKVILLK